MYKQGRKQLSTVVNSPVTIVYLKVQGPEIQSKNKYLCMYALKVYLSSVI